MTHFRFDLMVIVVPVSSRLRVRAKVTTPDSFHDNMRNFGTYMELKYFNNIRICLITRMMTNMVFDRQRLWH